MNPTGVPSSGAIIDRMPLDRIPGHSPELSVSATANTEVETGLELGSDLGIKDHFTHEVRSTRDAFGHQDESPSNKTIPACAAGTSTMTRPKSPIDDRALPTEVWRSIMALVPPRTLGCLLLVNKEFHRYLTQSIKPSTQQKDSRRLDPEAIWQASRRRFWPNMPSPLLGEKEVDMWRLACSKKCQFCSKVAKSTTWSKTGPGRDGVRTIWAFSISSCGPCLLKNCVKEIDLLLSSEVPSLILPALPFVMITQEFDVYSPGTTPAVQIPDETQVTKVYPASLVKALKDEFFNVKSMGQATAEEWIKGLEIRRKERFADAARWERWGSSSGVLQMNNMLYPGSSITLTAKSGAAPGLTSATVSKGDAFSSRPHPPSLPQPLRPPRPPRPRNRARTDEEIQRLKANRKAEIERRAGLLDPPIHPHVVSHLPAFQAALHIAAPLEEKAWDQLKPRLQAQRIKVEPLKKPKKEKLDSSFEVQKRSEGLGTQPTTGLNSKESIDREWDEVQAPLRARISAFADERVRDFWNNGLKVNENNVSRFAVDVLLSVRKRFYAGVAKNAAVARAAGQTPAEDQPNKPYALRLTLENMKWLFETKIKPHTQSIRRELFHCNACYGTGKPYGFEGVIQHYAAKHTKSFTLGSVIVYWRSEWAIVPPFNPECCPKTLASGASATANSQGPIGGAMDISPLPLYDFQPLPLNALPFHPHQALFGPSHPLEMLPPSMHTSFGPQSGFPPPPLPPPSPPQALCGPLFSSPSYSQLPSFPAYVAPMPEHPAMGMMPYTQHKHQDDMGPSRVPQAFVQDQNSGNYQHTNDPLWYRKTSAVGPPAMDISKAQHDQIARISRELWTMLNFVKEVNGNIKVCVILHHVAKQFRMHFGEDPSLNMFIDGLSSSREMRQVRSYNGLVCKACRQGLGLIGDERSGVLEKPFSLPRLVLHFQEKHVEPLVALGVEPLDWINDMVYIPEFPNLASLCQRIDSHRYNLIAEAFSRGSEIVETEKTREVEKVMLKNSVDNGTLGSRNTTSKATRKGADLSKSTQHLSTKPSPRTSSGEVTPETYDPHGSRIRLTQSTQNSSLGKGNSSGNGNNKSGDENISKISKEHNGFNSRTNVRWAPEQQDKSAGVKATTEKREPAGFSNSSNKSTKRKYTASLQNSPPSKRLSQHDERSPPQHSSARQQDEVTMTPSDIAPSADDNDHTDLLAGLESHLGQQLPNTDAI